MSSTRPNPSSLPINISSSSSRSPPSPSPTASHPPPSPFALSSSCSPPTPNPHGNNSLHMREEDGDILAAGISCSPLRVRGASRAATTTTTPVRRQSVLDVAISATAGLLLAGDDDLEDCVENAGCGGVNIGGGGGDGNDSEMLGVELNVVEELAMFKEATGEDQERLIIDDDENDDDDDDDNESSNSKSESVYYIILKVNVN